MDPLAASLEAAREFAAMLRAELDASLGPLWDAGAEPEVILEECRRTLERAVGPLGRVLGDAALAAWLTGAGHVAERLPDARLVDDEIDSPIALNLPARQGLRWDGMKAWRPVVDSAIDNLQSRQLLTRDAWDVVSEDVRRRAFTVAFQSTSDSVGEVRDAVEEAVDQGHGLPEFRENVERRLGRGALSIGHLSNILRTGTSRAMSDGMDAALEVPLVGEYFPFEEVVGIDDSRQSDLCAEANRAGLQGTGIFLRSDPVYQRLKVPRHWSCRCTRIPRTVADAAARGIMYAQEWLRRGEQPMPPAHVDDPGLFPPEGWLPGNVSLSWTPEDEAKRLYERGAP